MPPATKVWQAPNNINSLILAVPKLKTAITWQDWKFSICMVFRRAGVHDVTVVKKIPNEDEKDSDWDAKVQESLTIIGLTIDPSNYVHIRSATNGAEAWIALAGVYEKNSRATRISLKRQLYGYKHNPHAPMQDYISDITTLAAQLAALGDNVALSITDITDLEAFRASLTCFKCGKEGHMARNCRSKAPKANDDKEHAAGVWLEESDDEAVF